MLRWSSSHPIPTSSANSEPAADTSTSAYRYGDDVLIVTETMYRSFGPTKLEMFLFRTELKQIEKLEFPLLDTIAGVRSIICHDGYAYIWGIQKNDDIFNWDNFNHILYKVDINTMEHEKIIELVLSYWSGDTPIIGGLMYVLEEQIEDHMYVINLKEKKLVSRFTLEEEDVLTSGHYWRHLLGKNGKVYLLQRGGENKERTVSIIEGRKEVVLLKDDYREGDVRYIGAGSDWTDGTVINVYLDKEHKYITIDTYDFEKNKWSRKKAERGWYSPWRHILASVKINDTIYAVMKVPRVKSYQLEVKVLEIVPKLSTACLFKVIDMIDSDKKNGGCLEEEMRFYPLKKELDAMIKWKKDAKESWEQYILDEQQKNVIVEELKVMVAAGMIEKEIISIMESSFRFASRH